MMCAADVEGERRAHEVRAARSWAQSGLMTAAEAAAVEKAGAPPPAAGGTAMRLLLFGFALMVMTSFHHLFGPSWSAGARAHGRFILGESVLALIVAELIVRRLSLHRFGVDEALLFAAPPMIGVGAAMFWDRTAALGPLAHPTPAAGALAGGLAAALVYARHRRLPALLQAVLAAPIFVLSFQPAHPRAWLVGVWLLLLFISLVRPGVPDFERERWEGLQGMLALLVPLACNLRLETMFSSHPARGAGAAYWLSYLAVWMLPLVALFAGVGLRRRPLIVSAVVALLVAVLTNKPYWGLERHSWDPAVLGLVLLALAAALDRWLRAGADGRREGFTAAEVVVARDDGAGLLLAAGAAAAAGSWSGAPRSDQGRLEGGGGSAGGAGASGSF